MTTLLFITFYHSLSIRLAWIDFKTGLLPDRFTCPLLWGGVIYYLVHNDDFLSASVTGAVTGYFCFWTVYWAFRLWKGYEGLGFGDVKLLAALGAWHGWESLSTIVFLAATGGLITFLVASMISGRRKIVKTPQPFGPFLVAAGFAVSCRTFYAPAEQVITTLL
ncbi:A24 family peptidase [Franconibacter helveticus]|uniref:prepilin peptidase n=1 Tax=Franconibacter helveticus TaxID=357240 RepID=UPI000DA14308|nr:A24 family peptidase [Franconibacter helveticus]MDU6926981.1 A24 family peptidase [Franconibacter helveticus]